MIANRIMEFLKQHRDNVNQPFLPRFNKVTKDNVCNHWSMIRSRIIDLTTHHIRKNTCCILHFYELITCNANNEILYFKIYNLSRIKTFNEHTYTEISFCQKRIVILNKFFVYFLSCVYQVNREDRL